MPLTRMRNELSRNAPPFIVVIGRWFTNARNAPKQKHAKSRRASRPNGILLFGGAPEKQSCFVCHSELTSSRRHSNTEMSARHLFDHVLYTFLRWCGQS